MNITYIANMRMPTEKAHGIQIMKTCESLAKNGVTLSLVVPKRHSDISEDVFTYYGVEPLFAVKKFAVLDTVSFGKIGFLVETFSFLVSIILRSTLFKKTVLYSRDEIILAPLALLYKEHVVWESHSGTWNIFSRYLATRANKIVVISHGLKQFYLEKGVPEAKLIVAPDGVDLYTFSNPPTKEEARAILGLSDMRTIVMYIGRVDSWKGVQVLLDAVRHLPSSVDIVIIGGEPDQVKHLKKKNPTVTFLGYRPYTEISANLAAADVLVLPNIGTSVVSSTFTSPLKLFAYMASGKPIILSDLPSLREVLSDENAEFFEAGNATALATAIMRTVTKKESAELKGRRAQELVKQYSWERRAESIYKAVT